MEVSDTVYIAYADSSSVYPANLKESVALNLSEDGPETFRAFTIQSWSNRNGHLSSKQSYVGSSPADCAIYYFQPKGCRTDIVIRSYRVIVQRKGR